jgi:archaeosortase B (VPXXXP-CTERM-specific)
MSQDDPAQQPTSGGAPDERRRSTLARRLGAFWSVPTYRFALIFFAFLVGIAMIYPGMRTRFPPAFALTETVTAELVYRLLSCFSSEVKLTDDTTIFFGPFPVEIIEECSGIYEALLLGAALLAFPTSWYKTALGFAIGFPLIYAMNIVRIAVLLVIGRYFPHSFDFLHLYFWQGTMIAMVASTWLIWVLWVVRGDGALGAPRGASP